MVVVAALTACSLPAGPLKSGEQDAVAMKNASIVLLRLAAANDGKPVDLDVHVYPVVFRLFLSVENIDTGEQIMGDGARFPAPEARKAGWFYLVLPPGRYYLRVRGLTTTTTAVTSNFAQFFLSVPPAHPVLYVGSLPLTCRERRGFNQSLFCAPPKTVADDNGLAAQIAQLGFA